MQDFLATYWPELVALAGFVLGEIGIAVAASWVERKERRAESHTQGIES